MQLIVSGQPKLGHESWPPQKETVLSDNLYGKVSGPHGADEETRMEVRIEKKREKFVTYYHYSKLKDVTGCLSDDEKKRGTQDHGRRGSFFVMTLSLDGIYSINFDKIYNILDDLYNEYVDEKVLKKSNDGFLVYQIMQLSDAKDTWDTICKKLERKKDIIISDEKEIPSAFMPKRKKDLKYFSFDTNNSEIEKALLEDGGLMFLSTEEMLLREKRNAKKRLKSIVSSSEQINTLTKDIEDINDTTNDFFELVPASNESIIRKVNNLIKLLENRNEADKELVDKLRQLSDQQSTLNNELEEINGRFPRIRNVFLSHNKYILPIILAVLVLGEILLFILIPQGKEVSNNPSDRIDACEVSSVGSDKHVAGYNVLEDTIELFYEDKQITHLDLRNTSLKNANPPLIKGQSYVVVAKTGNGNAYENAKGNGTFTCSSNGVIIGQDKEKCTITVLQDIKDSKIKIEYSYMLGANTSRQTYERTFEIK